MQRNVPYACLGPPFCEAKPEFSDQGVVVFNHIQSSEKFENEVKGSNTNSIFQISRSESKLISVFPFVKNGILMVKLKCMLYVYK